MRCEVGGLDGEGKAGGRVHGADSGEEEFRAERDGAQDPAGAGVEGGAAEQVDAGDGEEPAEAFGEESEHAHPCGCQGSPVDPGGRDRGGELRLHVRMMAYWRGGCGGNSKSLDGESDRLPRRSVG